MVSTTADLARFYQALLGGRLLGFDLLKAAVSTRPRQGSGWRKIARPNWRRDRLRAGASGGQALSPSAGPVQLRREMRASGMPRSPRTRMPTPAAIDR